MEEEVKPQNQKIVPRGDRVLIERQTSYNERIGSLYVPSDYQDEFQVGCVVLACGEDVSERTKLGDVVLVGRFGTLPVGKDHFLVHEKDILAKLEPAD